MAFVSVEQVQRESKVTTATCRRCGEEGLMWDKAKSGRNWMYDVQLATSEQIDRFEADPESVANARQTTDFGLVIVLKYRPHDCPARNDGPYLGDGDRVLDLDVNDEDTIVGQRLQDEARDGLIVDDES